MKRLFLLIYRTCKFRSYSSAKWMQAYDDFTPTHGK